LANGVGVGGLLDRVVQWVQGFGYNNTADVELAVVLITFTYLG